MTSRAALAKLSTAHGLSAPQHELFLIQFHVSLVRTPILSRHTLERGWPKRDIEHEFTIRDPVDRVPADSIVVIAGSMGQRRRGRPTRGSPYSLTPV